MLRMPRLAPPLTSLILDIGFGHSSPARYKIIRLAMASEQETAITTQPISRRKEIESFVRDLDPLEVVGKHINIICQVASHCMFMMHIIIVRTIQSIQNGLFKMLWRST